MVPSINPHLMPLHQQTVILDVCSHKSDSSPPIPLDLDENLRSLRPVALPHTQWSRFTLESHVLLAGCSPGQHSVFRRRSNLGVFTEALVASLRRVDLTHTTYAELIDELSLPHNTVQTPYCKGINKDAPVFQICANDIRYQTFER